MAPLTSRFAAFVLAVVTIATIPSVGAEDIHIVDHTNSKQFDEYRWSLFFQDVMLHRAKYFVKTFNDNHSNEITQSALLKRFSLRYAVNTKTNFGLALQISLRDEATFINGVEADKYHPFKIAGLTAGHMLWSAPLAKARIEQWGDARLNLALSDRVAKKSMLQAGTEIVIAFSEYTLITLAAEIARNIDDGLFYSLQYGIGWRF